jgi:hypothetical protein
MTFSDCTENKKEDSKGLENICKRERKSALSCQVQISLLKTADLLITQRR